MIKTLTELVIALEDAMITPISRDDLRYNDGIRTAIMIVESARDRLYEDSKETKEG